MVDWPSANMYADKALAAGSGHRVGPLDPKAWRGAWPSGEVRGQDKMAELIQARQRLLAGLANGSITRVPADAAYAQSNYDCWVEEQAEGWQFDHIAACKNGFMRAIQVVETLPGAPPPQAAEPAPAPGPFLVFFDWDRSDLTADARKVLDEVIAREHNSDEGVHLVGHADRSGPDNYNVKLSQRRANSVKTYLTSHGIAAHRISTEARGERDPLVQTADGVREPQNRRVSINIMTRMPGA
jgi:OmpA-OmpF porin, OOP family